MSPLELGKEAYKSGIVAACQDPKMMDYLVKNTDGQVGSGVAPLEKWNQGWHEEQQIELKARFPEMYQ